MTSIAAQRLVSTVINIPSPTGRAWHLAALQRRMQDYYGKTVSDTRAKRILAESELITLEKSADFPFEIVGYKAAVLPDHLAPKPAHYKRESFVHWFGKYGLMGIGVISILRWITGI